MVLPRTFSTRPLRTVRAKPADDSKFGDVGEYCRIESKYSDLAIATRPWLRGLRTRALADTSLALMMTYDEDMRKWYPYERALGEYDLVNPYLWFQVGGLPAETTSGYYKSACNEYHEGLVQVARALPAGANRIGKAILTDDTTDVAVDSTYDALKTIDQNPAIGYDSGNDRWKMDIEAISHGDIEVVQPTAADLNVTEANSSDIMSLMDDAVNNVGVYAIQQQLPAGTNNIGDVDIATHPARAYSVPSAASANTVLSTTIPTGTWTVLTSLAIPAGEDWYISQLDVEVGTLAQQTAHRGYVAQDATTLWTWRRWTDESYHWSNYPGRKITGVSGGSTLYVYAYHAAGADRTGNAQVVVRRWA